MRELIFSQRQKILEELSDERITEQATLHRKQTKDITRLLRRKEATFSSGIYKSPLPPVDSLIQKSIADKIHLETASIIDFDARLSTLEQSLAMLGQQT